MVLIPVDFSPSHFLAVNVGFELARRLSCRVSLLHASILPDPSVLTPQFPDDFNGVDNADEEIEEVEIGEEVHEIDTRSMDALKKKISALQTEGKLPDIKYDTVLAPGMPEEVISEYCAVTPPKVVVMATRGCEKRREELIGSVTAEVIDHAMAPVFTVPENYSFIGFKDIVRICAFCYFDDGDFACISKLMEMFGCPAVKIYLFPATSKDPGLWHGPLPRIHAFRMLQKRLQEAFPNSEFVISEPADWKNLRQEAEYLFTKESIQMILAPNRKRNAISRFFNPGLPHKILYEIDFPMLAIPV